jgi:hypothetical protein
MLGVNLVFAVAYPPSAWLECNMRATFINRWFGRRRRDVEDINAAINAYSYQGGNRPDRLQAVCAHAPAADKLATEISGLQEGIYELVRARAGADGLSRAEVEQVALQYLAATRPDVNEIGVHGLLRYVIWIAWHDGWLRFDDK